MRSRTELMTESMTAQRTESRAESIILPPEAPSLTLHTNYPVIKPTIADSRTECRHCVSLTNQLIQFEGSRGMEQAVVFEQAFDSSGQV